MLLGTLYIVSACATHSLFHFLHLLTFHTKKESTRNQGLKTDLSNLSGKQRYTSGMEHGARPVGDVEQGTVNVAWEHGE